MLDWDELNDGNYGDITWSFDVAEQTFAVAFENALSGLVRFRAVESASRVTDGGDSANYVVTPPEGITF
jgi:hypothetical protein